MKHVILIPILLLLFLTSHAQTECELLHGIQSSLCDHLPKKTIELSEKFLKKYPKNEMENEVRLLLAKKYFEIGESDKSITIAKSLMADGYKENIQAFTYREQCLPAPSDPGESCINPIYKMQRRELKHQASVLLYKVFMKENDIDQARYYLDLSIQPHSYQTKSGNGYYWNEKRMALNYSELFEKKQDIDSALWVLTPYIFSHRFFSNRENDEIIDRFTTLLQHQTIDFVPKDSLTSSLNNMMIKKEIVWSDWKVEEDEENFDESLMIQETAYYGRAVYFTFMGQTFTVLKVNDYLSKRTAPNHSRRKRKKLKLHKTNEELLRMAKAIIRQKRFYKNIMSQ